MYSLFHFRKLFVFLAKELNEKWSCIILKHFGHMTDFSDITLPVAFMAITFQKR